MVIKNIHIDTTRYLIKISVLGSINASVTKYDKFKLEEPLVIRFSSRNYDLLKERISIMLGEYSNNDCNFKVITEQAFEQILNSDVIQTMSRKY